MNELLDLIQQQPTDQPIWSPGRQASEDGYVEDGLQHAFILEPIPGFEFPKHSANVPLCRFVNGARYVVLDLADVQASQSTLPECGDCLALSLIHF